jgi:hypothetical protein
MFTDAQQLLAYKEKISVYYLRANFRMPDTTASFVIVTLTAVVLKQQFQL